MNHDAGFDFEAAQSLVSLQLQAATSVDDSEEELGDVHAPKPGSRGTYKRPARYEVDLSIGRQKMEAR